MTTTKTIASLFVATFAFVALSLAHTNAAHACGGYGDFDEKTQLRWLVEDHLYTLAAGNIKGANAPFQNSDASVKAAMNAANLADIQHVAQATQTAKSSAKTAPKWSITSVRMVGTTVAFATVQWTIDGTTHTQMFSMTQSKGMWRLTGKTSIA